MLKEPVEKAFSGQPYRAPVVVLAILVGEGDALAIVGQDAFGAEGGAIHIGGQVFQRRFAGADGLNIGYPIQRPDHAWDLDEQVWVVLLQGVLEA
jgi:hypothetical protein